MTHNYYLMNLYILQDAYTNLVINLLVNNLCTLSIWSMRLRHLLTFEKCDNIMDA